MVSETQPHIGKLLRLMRKASGYSSCKQAADAARKAGISISEQALRNMEAGQVQKYDICLVFSLTWFYGFPAGTVLEAIPLPPIKKTQSPRELYTLGMESVKQADYKKASAYFLSAYHSVEDKQKRIKLLHNLALSLFKSGYRDLTIIIARKGMNETINEDSQLCWDFGYILVKALIDTRAGLGEAEYLVLGLTNAASNDRDRALITSVSAILSFALGRAEKAAGEMAEANRMFNDLNDQSEAINTAVHLGYYNFHKGEHEKGLQIMKQALDNMDSLKHKPLNLMFRVALNNLYISCLAVEDIEKADLLARESISKCRENNFDTLILWLAGKMYEAVGEKEKKEYYEKLVEEYEKRCKLDFVIENSHNGGYFCD